MRIPAITANLGQTEDAAARLLEAERTALAEVELSRRQALQLVATGWLRAELLHKRTKARIKHVRERMTAAAQDRQARIRGDLDRMTRGPVEEECRLAALDRAIARIVEELAGCSESS